MSESLAKPNVKGVKRRIERNILTFYEKIAVIRYYEETHISRNTLAKMFHCCTTQIRRILDKKHLLLQQLESLSERDASIIMEEIARKRRKFEVSAISFILHRWVERCRQLRLKKVISNDTLRETALKMAAILNLPTFRPSYRWLNRFRGKYKYSQEDLGIGSLESGDDTIVGELAVEDIIIEFKDFLPSFMQKEISRITSTTKMEEVPNEIEAYLNEYGNNNFIDHIESAEETIDIGEMDPFYTMNPPKCSTVSNEKTNNTIKSSDVSLNENNELNLNSVNIGSSVILSNVFSHLGVIHQFALLNSDVKALDIISQLVEHVQTQFSNGFYKKTIIETQNNENCNDNLYGDIDDIVLID